MTRTRPWFEEAFGRGYLTVYPHRDLAAARTEVQHLVEQGVSGRTLDLGCGFGRHSLAFREKGIEIYGLDLSAELLGHARDHQESSGTTAAIEGRLVRGDFRRLPFRDAGFRTVCMLFSSFGYFDDEENLRVLCEVRRLLEPGGIAVFDLMNPQRIRSSLVPRSTTEREGFLLHEVRALTEGGRRVTKDVRIELAGGHDPLMWREDVRIYEREEFALLAQGAGLRVERFAGDFAGSEITADSAHQVAWTRAEPA